LRDQHHNLTDQEVRSLAIYAGMSGGLLMTSDNLQELADERLRLWKFVLSMDSNTCHFPLLGESSVSYKRIKTQYLNNPQYPNNPVTHEPRLLDPVIVQVRPKFNSDPEVSAVFILNTGEFPVQRSFDLELLGLSGRFWVLDWWQRQAWSEMIERLSVTLGSHDGVLLLLSKKPFSEDFIFLEDTLM
jgi:alpha-galactosidase